MGHVGGIGPMGCIGPIGTPSGIGAEAGSGNGIGACALAWVAKPRVANAAKNHRFAMVATSQRTQQCTLCRVTHFQPPADGEPRPRAVGGPYIQNRRNNP
jgi:hypothetical protein